jgi:hypothetical protein
MNLNLSDIRKLYYGGKYSILVKLDLSSLIRAQPLTRMHYSTSVIK